MVNWSKLVADQRILAIMEKMVFGGLENLPPSVDDNGEIYYPAIQDVVGKESINLLEELSKEGALVRSSDTRLLACPDHGDSLSLAIRLKCPTCTSSLIRKGAIAQHACGYIGSELALSEVCPKCKRPSPPQSLRRMGVWHECDECKGRFANPEVALYCRKYNHEFPLQEVKLIDQASYKLLPEVAKDFREKVGTVVMLKQGLQALGLPIEASLTLQGSSGVKHTFDFVVQANQKKYYMDVKVSAEGAVATEAVLSTYLKSFDTGSSPSILVAVPQASNDAKSLAKTYGILLIEGSEHDKLLQQLQAIFKS